MTPLFNQLHIDAYYSANQYVIWGMERKHGRNESAGKFHGELCILNPSAIPDWHEKDEERIKNTPNLLSAYSIYGNMQLPNGYFCKNIGEYLASKNNITFKKYIESVDDHFKSNSHDNNIAFGFENIKYVHWNDMKESKSKIQTGSIEHTATTLVYGGEQIESINKNSELNKHVFKFKTSDVNKNVIKIKHETKDVTKDENDEQVRDNNIKELIQFNLSDKNTYSEFLSMVVESLFDELNNNNCCDEVIKTNVKRTRKTANKRSNTKKNNTK